MSCDVAARRPGGEEHGRGGARREPELQMQPQHQDRGDREAAAGGIEAEQRRQFEDGPTRRLEHVLSRVVRDVWERIVVAAQSAVDDEEHDRRRVA